MLDNVKFLLRLFWQPAAAMSAILDEGSLLVASLAVLAVSLLTPHWVPFSFYTPLLLLAVVYVPGAVLLAMLERQYLERRLLEQSRLPRLSLFYMR